MRNSAQLRHCVCELIFFSPCELYVVCCQHGWRIVEKKKYYGQVLHLDATAAKIPQVKNREFWLPCSMKFLREIYFADRGFFVFCGKFFLRFGTTDIVCWEVIFVISVGVGYLTGESKFLRIIILGEFCSAASFFSCGSRAKSQNSQKFHATRDLK